MLEASVSFIIYFCYTPRGNMLLGYPSGLKLNLFCVCRELCLVNGETIKFGLIRLKLNFPWIYELDVNHTTDSQPFFYDNDWWVKLFFVMKRRLASCRYFLINYAHVHVCMMNKKLKKLNYLFLTRNSCLNSKIYSIKLLKWFMLYWNIYWALEKFLIERFVCHEKDNMFEWTTNLR